MISAVNTKTINVGKQGNTARAVRDTCRHYFKKIKGIAVFSVAGSEGYYPEYSLRLPKVFENITIGTDCDNACHARERVNYFYFSNEKLIAAYNKFQEEKWDKQNLKIETMQFYDRKNYVLFHEICKEINLLANWPIITPPFQIYFKSNLHESIGGYVFILNYKDNFKEMRRQIYFVIMSFKKRNMLNMKGIYLLVIVGGIPKNYEMRIVMQRFAFNELFNVIVIFEDKLGRFLLYNAPLAKNLPVKNCRRVEKPRILNVWLPNGSFVRNASLDFIAKVEDFKKCFVYMTAKVKVNTNIIYSLSEIIMKHIKFPFFDSSGPTNDHYYTRMYVDTGIASELNYGHVPLHISQYSWFIRLAEPYPRWASLTRVFGGYAWLCLSVSIFVSSAICWILVVITNIETYEGRPSFIQCLLKYWGIIFNIGVSMPKRMVIRWIFLSWIIYCMCINTIFQTYVTSYLTDPGRVRQIKNVEEVMKLNYNLIISQHDNIFFVFGDQIPHGVKYFPKEKDALLYTLKNVNSSIFLNENLLTKTYKELCGMNVTQKFYKLSGYESSYYDYVRFTNIYIAEKFSKVLQRFLQSGIANKVINDECDPKGVESVTLLSTSLRDEYVEMSLLHFQSMFFLYFFMNLFAILIFLCELIYHKLITKFSYRG